MSVADTVRRTYRRDPWSCVILVMLIPGLVAEAIWLRSLFADEPEPERARVVRVAVEVAAGDRLTVDVLRLGEIDAGIAAEIGAVAADDLDEVVGMYARRELAPSQVLRHAAIRATAPDPDGFTRVNRAHRAGDLPAEIAVGDEVWLVYVPAHRCGLRRVPEPVIIAGTVVRYPSDVGALHATEPDRRVFTTFLVAADDYLGATSADVLMPATAGEQAAAFADALSGQPPRSCTPTVTEGVEPRSTLPPAPTQNFDSTGALAPTTTVPTVATTAPP